MNRNCILLLFILFSSYAYPQTPLTLTMEDAEKIFLDKNLELIANRYTIDMAQAQITQAKLFDNPVISLEQNIYNRLNGKYFDVGKEGEAGVQIEQVINLAGQRSKRVRLEKINKSIAEYQFEEVLRTLRSELKETFIEIFYLSRSVSIYDREIASLSDLIRVMSEQKAKGNVSFLETSRLQALLLSLRKEKNELESGLLEKRNTLNLLLNLPADKEVTPLFDETILDSLDLSEISFSELVSRLHVRPDLKLAQSSVEASQANLKLQKSLAAPEFSVQGIYDRAGNFIDNYFALGVTVSVPIFNRNQGNIKSARIEIMKTSKEKELAGNKAYSELYAAYIRLQKNYELYRSTNTELEENFGNLIAGADQNYRKRNIGMLEFIDCYSGYKEACLQIYETRKNVLLSMENLNTVSGNTIFQY